MFKEANKGKFKRCWLKRQNKVGIGVWKTLTEFFVGFRKAHKYFKLMLCESLESYWVWAVPKDFEWEGVLCWSRNNSWAKRTKGLWFKLVHIHFIQVSTTGSNKGLTHGLKFDQLVNVNCSHLVMMGFSQVFTGNSGFYASTNKVFLKIFDSQLWPLTMQGFQFPTGTESNCCHFASAQSVLCFFCHIWKFI